MAIPNQILIDSSTNTVNIQTNDNQLRIISPVCNTEVNVTQPITTVIQVATPGPTGPAGPASTSSFDTGSFATTGSNIFIGNQTITGSIFVSGSLISNSFTGSLQGTSSWANNAITASYVLNAISASFALTASFVQNAQTASYVLNAVSASFASNATSASFASSSISASFASNATSASFASSSISASFASNATSASFASNSISASFASNATSASFAANAQTANTASYVLNAVSSSFASTASFVQNAQTASYVLNAVSSSHAVFAQNALFATSSLSASFASSSISASHALNSTSASFASNATSASFASNSISASFASNSISASFASTSSYALNALSASYALTASFVQNAVSASYALNGGVTQLLAGPNVTLSPTNGLGQVTVSATLSGSTIFNTATGSYGSFYDTTIQTNPVANIARSMSFNSTDITNGVSISGSTSPFNTYIKTTNAGVYDIQFSAQVEKTDSGTDVIVIWLRKNGIDLTDSATKLTLSGNSTKVVAAWNWFVSSAANDYYQIIWVSADTGMRLYAEPINDTPGIPSVIATVNRVDQFLSNTGSFSGSFTGVFTGSLQGTASFATSASFASTVPASGVIGLNLSQIATASFTASVSPTQFTVTSASITEFTVTGTGVTIGNAITDTHRVTGSLNISGSTNINGDVQLTGSMFSTGSRFTFRTTGTVDAVTITGSTGAYANSIVSINGLNQANQNSLRVFNLGVGDAGILMQSAAGGDLQFKINGFDHTNRNFTFNSINNAFDSSGVSYTFADRDKTSTHQKSFLIRGSTTFFKSGSYFEVQKSGSIPILHLAGDAQSGSFSPNELYISGSLRVNSGNSVITGSLTVVSGNARELQVTSTGVNIGNIITDTHTITGSLNISGSVTTTSLTSSTVLISGSGTNRLIVIGSGSAQPIFNVQGSQGELFSVTDNLSGSLFSVNDISGLPILEVFSDNTTLIGSYLDPMLITTTKITQTNSGSFVVYSLPTASYDTAFFEYSVKSGSNARAGTIMAIQSGTSVNFTETTTTDFGNTTPVSFTVVVTGSNMALTGSSTTGSWTIKTIVRGI
jgi:hypothetical protein